MTQRIKANKCIEVVYRRLAIFSQSQRPPQRLLSTNRPRASGNYRFITLTAQRKEEEEEEEAVLRQARA